MTENAAGTDYVLHFEELRSRIIRCILYLLVGSVLGLFVANYVLEILTRPLANAVFYRKEQVLHIKADEEGNLSLVGPTAEENEKHISRFRMKIEFPDGKTIQFGPDYRTNFYYFRPIDPFILWLKASIIVGVILAVPFIFREVWGFVKPGLEPHEIKAVKPVILGGVVLFPLGVAFAYFMLRFALSFFTRYAFEGLEPRLSVLSYINFALTMMIAAGCVFELPIAMVILGWMGVVNAEFLRKYRKHAIIVLFVLSALITPPDIFTMFAVGLPLLALYEISILLVSIVEKKKKAELAG